MSTAIRRAHRYLPLLWLAASGLLACGGNTHMAKTGDAGGSGGSGASAGRGGEGGRAGASGVGGGAGVQAGQGGQSGTAEDGGRGGEQGGTGGRAGASGQGGGGDQGGGSGEGGGRDGAAGAQGNCDSATLGVACAPEGTICGKCSDPCQFCSTLRCQGGHWQAQEGLPLQCFDCGGPGVRCEKTLQYCKVTTSHAGTSAACASLPSGCQPTPSCACLSNPPLCQADGGAITVTIQAP